MKRLKYSLFVLTLTAFIACSSDDNQEQDNQENTATTIFAEDGVNRNLKLEGIYFLAGPSSLAADPYNSIKTDNPTNDRLPFDGKVAYSTLNDGINTVNIDTNTIPFITVAGQTLNASNDVFDLPSVTNFSYSALTIIRPQDAQGLTPNIKIERIQDVELSNATGHDFHGQKINRLTAGKFKITTLESGSSILGYTSNGQSVVNSITLTVDQDAFPRNADGMVARRSPNGVTIPVQNLIEELFNNGAVEACLLETVDANPLKASNKFTYTAHYGL